MRKGGREGGEGGREGDEGGGRQGGVGERLNMKRVGGRLNTYSPLLLDTMMPPRHSMYSTHSLKGIHCMPPHLCLPPT